ncbi:hypothetical protein PR202_ga20915 [Eleusine coracana subsp. coracana]|uniref:Uncharacterized protein n=1 Tax=Eleusine coracana subsp. coracana TaxID=191504 RepID=A0AAV5CXU3_ELECO|nr:hypothetical protein PR202_ga20915 [Eleusine coracana subsp. coracana]
MYVTKPLSLFKSTPEAVSMPPLEGRNFGYLVLKDNEKEDGNQTSRWDPLSHKRVWELPFPQNRVLKVQDPDDEETVVFVPVPDQPLASNRYYVVIAKGHSRGLIRTCSREEDMITCFCKCIQDVDPRPFDPADIYQQIEIVQRKRGSFTARPVAADGFPPMLYRYEGWRVYASEYKKFSLGEASGLEDALRSRWLCHRADRPDAFPAPSIIMAVGKWYCPFYLVKEDGVSLRKQMDRSIFYEMMLEQRWEPIHGSKLASKNALIGGSVEARQDPRSSRHSSAYVWFRAASTEQRVGLCTSVWERMLWVQHRGGWVDQEVDNAGMVTNGYVLVERFVVKRMDGGVVLALDFAHLNRLQQL